ncbi:unnamed protein product [Ceutorhynchus assimilis]|uniref:YqaJ viral recombinase domain-containing protein n=1 Tax=Ceutorhynchus assimilis TaxID=467358 RepID=A0A9N9MV00_9CUCU|nr:unnamed protein product [Ceutorhynchus assimilis]
MALVAKCTGGKRINFSGSISYTTRAYDAAISHASGRGPAWHLEAWRGTVGKTTNKILGRKQQKHMNRKNKATPRKKNTKTSGQYGPDAAQPDISDAEMISQKNLFLQKLGDRVSTKLLVDEIEKKNKRKKELHTEAILYGRINEKTAIVKYEQINNVTVDRCGLFIDPNHPFLGASPDGLIGEKGIIEVKCLPSIKGKLVESEVPHCYSIINNEITLKQNHNYFYQVQGQLNITNRDFCDFVICTDDDFHIERINIDRELWSTTMLPKLTTFYVNSILPEIVDGRVPRGLKVRDPTKDP